MPESKPDAIRSPLGFAGPGDASSRLTRLHEEFAPVLEVPRIYVRHQGMEHFITSDPADTLNYPAHCPRTGESRYQWADRGDGVLYGRLKDGP